MKMFTTSNGETIQILPKSEWDLLTIDQKEANQKKHNRNTKGSDSCRLCDQLLTDNARDNGFFVHMTVGGALVDVTTQINIGDESQGWFPIGSSCAKKLPKQFKTKL